MMDYVTIGGFNTLSTELEPEMEEVRLLLTASCGGPVNFFIH